MSSFKITTYSEDETQAIAVELTKVLKSNAILCLYGDLGSGKTTFVKGMAKALRIPMEDVQSPTFVLMRVYEGKLPVYHFDLYRLEDIKEIERIGLDDYLYDGGISVIEWADRLEDKLPTDYIRVDLKHKKENERQIMIKAFGKVSRKYVDDFQKKK